MNLAGDDASGPDTTCDIIQCAENEYVSDHTCQACRQALTILQEIWQMDLTQYVMVLCNDNVVCRITNVYNARLVHIMLLGMMPWDPDTTCDIIQCAENEYVSSHTCQACSHRELIMRLGIWQVDLTWYVMSVLCNDNYYVVRSRMCTMPTGYLQC